MKKYTANKYFTSTEGLIISDESGNTVINIKSDSSNDVGYLANKILAAINNEYYTKKAMIDDTNQNFEWGLITEGERMAKVEEILNTKC